MSEDRPLTPEARRRSADIKGTPVRIGDGVWLYFDAIPYFEKVWDDLFDQTSLQDHYDKEDVVVAGFRLITTNYDVSADEAVFLGQCATVRDVVRAIEIAIYGEERDDVTYSSWVRSAFLANGLDPASVPPRDRRLVLRQLVMAGRAIEPAKMITSVITSRKPTFQILAERRRKAREDGAA